MEHDKVREHSFDGIQEYDNDLPRWWVWLFIITVIFAVIYPFIYHTGEPKLASQTIDAEMAALSAAAAKAAEASGPGDEDLLKRASDSGALKIGQEVYATRCMACHGDKGQGVVGPNLTDDYWIHGGKITDVHHVVVNGVLEKGMLAWKGQLTPEQIDAVVAFVWTLHGTNPANPKAPQGELVSR